MCPICKVWDDHTSKEVVDCYSDGHRDLESLLPGYFIQWDAQVAGQAEFEAHGFDLASSLAYAKQFLAYIETHAEKQALARCGLSRDASL